MREPDNKPEANRRDAFRVPLTPSSALRAILSLGERELSVPLVNVSLTGMRVEIRSGSSVELSPGDEVGISLEAGDGGLALRGIVRQRDDAVCGIEFLDVPQAGDAQAALARIVMEQQRRWLAGRVAVREDDPRDPPRDPD